MLNLINNLDYNGFWYINKHVKENVLMDYLMIFLLNMLSICSYYYL